MQRVRYSVFVNRNCTCIRTFIWIGWLIGLVLGLFLSQRWRTVTTGLVYSAISNEPSLFDLLISTLLPYIVFLYAIKNSEPWLLPVLCCMKAFMLAFCAFGIAFAFGSAGWLVRFFALFSDFLTLPAFLLYCHYFVANPHKLAGFFLWVYPVYVVLVVLCNHYCVSPYFVHLLN